MSQEQVTAKTIDLLSKFIKKTPLNVKLLSKPPFRYLHDLITETINTTGVFNGLYSQEELKQENYKDKETKVAFLQKIIDGLRLATKAELKVNPLKIVAGLEFQETNLMLQLLAKAVLKKVETHSAVETITGKVILTKTKTKLSPQKPLSSTKKEDRELKRPVSEDPPASVPTMEVEVAVESPPPPVSKIHQDTEVTKTPLVTQQILSSRPMTARLPPPKAKKEVTEREEVFNHVPVALQDLGQEDDGDFQVNILADNQFSQQKLGDDGKGDGLHGGLVSKILQAKRDLNGSLEGTAVGEKVSLPVGIKEINALKESIQLLCQSTNPLGKTLDYVQEDIDAMNKEIDIWKIEGEKYDSQLKEKDETERYAIKPLEEKLSKIEASIQEQLAKIASLKGEILMNDAQTEKILNGIASAN